VTATLQPTLVSSTVMRRLVILTEGQFGPHHGKTAMGVIRYGTDPIAAVLDSSIAGRNVSEWVPGRDIPAVATLDEALALPEPPDTLLIGIAPTGGRLPDSWRRTILDAIDAGMEVHSGLHTFLGDDPEFSAEAAAKGVRIVDYRRPPERHETAVGRPHGPGKRVILTVGTDCAIGKMSVALELRKSALALGDQAVFVPTGQTGMMIDGWGVAVDRVISDFVQGTVEWMVEEAEARGDWILVEGQGSLDHPAYSSVTLGLIHGATPHAMVMVHKPGLAAHDFDHRPDVSFPIARLPEFIRLHEAVAGLVAPSRVVGVALNTMLYPSDADARRIIDEIAAETGLPADDPVRFGADRLWPAVRDAVDALPWVAKALPVLS
jgi:D-glutamate N-acetyltransferase